MPFVCERGSTPRIVTPREDGGVHLVSTGHGSMPLYKTDALILKTYKLGESDRIVVFLTRDRGKRRGVAKNAGQSRRRFGAGLEPMTCGRVGYQEWERRDLVLLTYIEPTRSPLTVSDVEVLGHMGYFAELIDEWAPEGDPNEALYRLGASVVDAVTMGGSVSSLARYFEYWLLRLQGVYQADPTSSEPARAFLEAARLRGPLAMADVRVTPRALQELEVAHRALISTHLERDLKSTSVLRAMRK